ncbi:MAG: HAMP domain-containing protein, partial [Prevotellaceae bacterium]|nr:HAMP domain-containing protein [Prevotellaceae bacterium]
MRWGIVGCVLLCLLFFSLSFVDFSRFHNFVGEIIRVEKRLHDRQNKLEAFALEILHSRQEEQVKIEGVNEDMVFYKFYKDSLLFWVNTFPISNDDIFPLDRMHLELMLFSPFYTEAIAQQPLSYINENERYVNLGSAWYVVRSYDEDPYRVIAALLIQTDYPLSNSVINNELNPHLHLRNHFSIVPINVDEGVPIFSRNGLAVFFNVLVDVQKYNQQSTMLFRWLSVLFAVMALFCFLRGVPKSRSFWIAIPLFGVLRLICLFLERQMVDIPIVSPATFSDAHFSGSLVTLLLNHLFIFFIVWAAMMVCRSFSRFFYTLRETPPLSFKRVVWTIFFALLPILLITYIHFSFRSLILHSTIVMEIFKVNELSLFTVLVYASFALLFAALYLLICMGWPLFFPKGSRTTLLSQKALVVYVVIVSLYSLIVVLIYGAQKETERNRTWTMKMAVERDPETEIFLGNVEMFISSDMILSAMLQNDQSKESIWERLSDHFFASLKNRYDLQVTTCKPGDNLLMEMTPLVVNCYNYFHQTISSCGTQLFEDSHFYYLDNANGRTSYIGVFPFRFYGGYKDLYIELDSKSVKESIGYPELLRDHVEQNRYQIPDGYSFAKYVRTHLQAFSGDYIYSTQLLSQKPVGSYFVTKSSDYKHYSYQFDDKTVILLSHPIRTLSLYLISFAYIVLFYLLIIFPIVLNPSSFIWRSKQKRSFRRKIMLLVIVSLVVALIAMAVGSISFGIKTYHDNRSKEMDEKMLTAKSTLEFLFRYVGRLQDFSPSIESEVTEQLNQLSKNIHIDINVYCPNGKLQYTSQPEIFEKHLMGKRMNSEAFQELNRSKLLKFVHQEHIAGLYYYSIYAPLFNNEEVLIGYVNLPYFSRQLDVANEVTSIIATIISIYIILLLLAVFGGTVIFNQLARPLEEVGRKMKRLDLTNRLEHIDYKGKDELGGLIQAYNQMVDDVSAASLRMAQTEREQAWREMARQIAHEIKNPLTPMRLSLQHLMRLKKENVPDWSDRFDGLAHTLIEQIDILSDAATELSSFSRFYSEKPAPVELNHLIEEQCNLFDIDDPIDLLFTSDVNPAFVMGRKQQLSRV